MCACLLPWMTAMKEPACAGSYSSASICASRFGIRAPNISDSMKLRGVSTRDRNCDRSRFNSDSFFASGGPALAFAQISSAVPSVK